VPVFLRSRNSSKAFWFAGFKRASGGNKSLNNLFAYVKVAIYQVLTPWECSVETIVMNAYQKAQDLIEKIQRQKTEVENRLQVIATLESELEETIQAARLPGTLAGMASKGGSAKSAGTPGGTRPLKPKAAAPSVQTSTAPSVKNSPAPAKKGAAKKSASLQSAKRVSPTNGQNIADSKGKPPTLGDLVREVIIEAGKPLRRVEIEKGLKKKKYKNSAKETYRTLGVRLHALESRGVIGLGDGLFDLTPDWKAKIGKEGQRAKEQTTEVPA
jgi:hypothetical protein